MSQIYLRRDEVEEERLPPICMRCGAPAAVRVGKSFSWHPPWVLVLLVAGLLPFIIVAVLLTKRMRVSAPLCDAHRSHWSARTLATLGSLGGFIALGFGVVLVFSEANRAGDALGAFVCPALLVLLLGWLVLVAVLQSTAIRPSEITDHSITLKGVHEEFCRAVEADRDDVMREGYRRLGEPDDRGAAADQFHDPRTQRRPRMPPDAFRGGER